MPLHTGHQPVGVQLHPTLLQIVLLVEKNAFHQDHDHWHAFHQMWLLCGGQRIGQSKMHSISKEWTLPIDVQSRERSYHDRSKALHLCDLILSGGIFLAQSFHNERLWFFCCPWQIWLVQVWLRSLWYKANWAGMFSVDAPSQCHHRAKQRYLLPTWNMLHNILFFVIGR